MNEINESTMILSEFENRLRAGLVLKHTMQTIPAVEQNNNKMVESPYNQSGRIRIC